MRKFPRSAVLTHTFNLKVLKSEKSAQKFYNRINAKVDRTEWFLTVCYTHLLITSIQEHLSGKSVVETDKTQDELNGLIVLLRDGLKMLQITSGPLSQLNGKEYNKMPAKYRNSFVEIWK